MSIIICIMLGAECGRDDTQPDQVVVGDLVWMTKNLDIDVGNNWYPAYNYTVDGKSVRITHKEYGRLYDWESAIEACESIGLGWRLPDYEDWISLANSLGGMSVAGGKLKSTITGDCREMTGGGLCIPDTEGHPFWYAPNTGATDEIGFSALPGGFRNPLMTGYFELTGYTGFWWSATEFSSTHAWSLIMSKSHERLIHGYHLKNSGQNVRCVRDN